MNQIKSWLLNLGEISHEIFDYEMLDHSEISHEICNYDIYHVLLKSDQYNPPNQFDESNHSNCTAVQPSASSDRFQSCFF